MSRVNESFEKMGSGTFTDESQPEHACLLQAGRSEWQIFQSSKRTTTKNGSVLISFDFVALNNPFFYRKVKWWIKDLKIKVLILGFHPR